MFVILYLIGICISVVTFVVIPTSMYFALGLVVALVLTGMQFGKFCKKINNRWLYLLVFVLDVLLFPSAILWNIHQAYNTSHGAA